MSVQDTLYHTGDDSKRDPPVPIPNTEVKPLSAECTWLETARENRTLPVFLMRGKAERKHMLPRKIFALTALSPLPIQQVLPAGLALSCLKILSRHHALSLCFSARSLREKKFLRVLVIDLLQL